MSEVIQAVDADDADRDIPARDPAPYTGLLTIGAFLALFVLGAVINSFFAEGGPYPQPSDTAERTVQWRTDNGVAVRFTGVMGFVAGLLLVWHGSWLAAVVARRTNNRQLTQLTFAGGMISGAFLLFGGLLQWIIQSPETLADVPLMRALDRLIFATAGPGSVIGFLLLVGAGAVALRRAGLIPTWLSWAGVVAAGLAPVSLLMLLPEGGELFNLVSLGRFPSLLWLLAIAVIVGRRLVIRHR
jgi:hypothetical protein